MNLASIRITKEAWNTMVAHARRDAPIEVCGYLGGRDNEIYKVYEMTNVDQSTEHFSFDPREQFDVVKGARKEGLTLIGCYHSHPATPARLSQEDLRLANDPYIIYFIVSLINPEPEIRAFRVKKGETTGVENVEIIVEL